MRNRELFFGGFMVIVVALSSAACVTESPGSSHSADTADSSSDLTSDLLADVGVDQVPVDGGSDATNLDLIATEVLDIPLDLGADTDYEVHARLPGEGDPCSPSDIPACQDGFVCVVPTNGMNSICAATCVESQECGEGRRCSYALGGLHKICWSGSLFARGDRCDDDPYACEVGLACFHVLGEMICLDKCSKNSDCENTDKCLDFGSEGKGCYSIIEGLDHGSRCDMFHKCISGYNCNNISGFNEFDVCHRPCNITNIPIDCPEGTDCLWMGIVGAYCLEVHYDREIGEDCNQFNRCKQLDHDCITSGGSPFGFCRAPCDPLVRPFCEPAQICSGLQDSLEAFCVPHPSPLNSLIAKGPGNCRFRSEGTSLTLSEVPVGVARSSYLPVAVLGDALYVSWQDRGGTSGHVRQLIRGAGLSLSDVLPSVQADAVPMSGAASVVNQYGVATVGNSVWSCWTEKQTTPPPGGHLLACRIVEGPGDQQKRHYEVEGLSPEFVEHESDDIKYQNFAMGSNDHWIVAAAHARVQENEIIILYKIDSTTNNYNTILIGESDSFELIYVDVSMSNDAALVTWIEKRPTGNAVMARLLPLAQDGELPSWQVDEGVTTSRPVQVLSQRTPQGFVIAWGGENLSGNDSHIYARLFGHFGESLSGSLVVNTQAVTGGLRRLLRPVIVADSVLIPYRMVGRDANWVVTNEIWSSLMSLSGVVSQKQGSISALSSTITQTWAAFGSCSASSFLHLVGNQYMFVWRDQDGSPNPIRLQRFVCE